MPDKVFRMGNPPLRIEVLTDISGVEFAACWKAREITEIDGINVNVINLDDLKRNKSASGRLKDKNDLTHLPRILYNIVKGQHMPNHPLAEVFGFPTDNMTEEANRHRRNRLCPFGNAVPNCTKTSIENPLGVCSVLSGSGEAVITCPVRFQQGWRIASDAAAFFFPPGAAWTSLTEVRLKDSAGKSAGNIDMVLLSYDALGRIIDYGSLEVQAVYISGNISTPFQHYMEDPQARADMDWRGQRNCPRPDYLSSSRKRLAPQLIFKGGILNGWGRKMAVALNTGFYKTLPALDEVDPAEADLALFIYDLVLDPVQNRYVLTLHKTVYTKFEVALIKITRSEAGEESLFLGQLQKQLDKRLNNAAAPDAITPDPEF